MIYLDYSANTPMDARVLEQFCAVERRCIGNIRRERPDLVERAGVGHETEPRDTAVRRFDADDTAERRRLPDRPAGVRSKRQRDQAGSDSGCRTARRTARHP